MLATANACNSLCLQQLMPAAAISYNSFIAWQTLSAVSQRLIECTLADILQYQNEV